MPTPYSPLDQLKDLLAEVDDLRSAAALLHWDQATYMPSGGASARGRQIATLSRLAHEKFTSPNIGELLDKLASDEAELAYESDEASLIRVTRREYEKAIRVPASFEARFTEHTALTYNTWTKARPANDFAAVRPLLEKTRDLSLELASFFPYQHPADPLIDFSDYGMRAESIRKLFAELRAELVPLVKEVTARPLVDDSCLRGHFPEDAQTQFGQEVLTAIGYDWERGRLDRTHHPFMTKFSLGDVRITNRYKLDDATEYFFGALHETGHALYEQGIDQHLEATPLANGTSSGVHESQSRLWENLVGRSQAFWIHFYPRWQEIFPAFQSVSREQFVAAINKVQRSLVRTDADELTYNLHVMIRFDLELAMLEGKLDIKDLPEAWRERYRSDLGVVPDTDTDGCLQDVHWHSGPIGGAFQGYTIGNVLSAQFFSAAQRAIPEIPQQLEHGEFTPLRSWLTEQVYRHGAKFTAAEITEMATGEPLTIGPYMEYLRGKYGT